VVGFGSDIPPLLLPRGNSSDDPTSMYAVPLPLANEAHVFARTDDNLVLQLFKLGVQEHMIVTNLGIFNVPVFKHDSAYLSVCFVALEILHNENARSEPAEIDGF
jgi:hypothetical protein